MTDQYRDLFLDKQAQLLEALKKAMAYLEILDEAKSELGVSNHEDIPAAIRKLKGAQSNDQT